MTHRKIKLIFTLLTMTMLFCIHLSPTESAPSSTNEITNKIFYLNGEKSEYPIINVNNDGVNFIINRDIQSYIADMRAAIDSMPKTTASFHYKIYYNDSSVLSVGFREYRYYYHAAHGNYFIHNIVYDKKTGKKISSSDYINLTVTDLQKAINNGSASIWGGDGQAELTPEQITSPTYVSQNYYLEKKSGKLFIGFIYPPYDLAPWSTGIIHIVLPISKG